MKLVRIAGALASLSSLTAMAQSCEGGVYLNPQVIRGEGTPQVVGAANELSGFVGRMGLSAAPIVNVSSLDDVLAALQRPKPPCWVFGNPVVGLASGYRPVAVNAEEIQAAVLLLGAVGPDKDPKPVELLALDSEEQAKVLAGLKGATCFGMKSGVTTALVKAQGLCGSVIDVQPRLGLGQSYLPTKAAFEWQPGRWVGWITRAQSARSANMRAQAGTDSRVHQARLVIVPTRQSSWGYGIYLRQDVAAEVAARVTAQFAGLQQPDPSLARALDLGATFRFITPKASDISAMRAALDMAP